MNDIYTIFSLIHREITPGFEGAEPDDLRGVQRRVWVRVRAQVRVRRARQVQRVQLQPGRVWPSVGTCFRRPF